MKRAALRSKRAKKKIISYCLWGSKPLYTFGMIINVIDALIYYPNWIVRVYCDQSVPKDITDVLITFKHVEVIMMPEGGDRTAMFWRFYPASDSSVYAMLSRNSDSRLSKREASAVEEWLQSDKGFHTMRDNSSHQIAILGGMWGVKRGILCNVCKMIDEFDKEDLWQINQKFLSQKVEPLVRNNWIEHDEFFAHKPFPTPRIDKEFIGESVSNDFHRVTDVYPHLSYFLEKENGTLYVLTRGGFGNVLFNYLIGYSLGKHYNMKTSYIPMNNGHRVPMNTYKLFNALGVNYCNTVLPLPSCIRISEYQWAYYDITLTDTTKNYYLDGYFQSYKHSLKYIQEIRDKVHKILYKSKLDRLFQEWKKDKKQVIMMHVRRGDYVNIPSYLPILTDEYYRDALSKLRSDETDHNLKNSKILVFSDDIPYVCTWPLLQGFDHTVVNIEDVEDCFYLMTLCDHFIIANSSLSLSAYYLRSKRSEDEKTVICMPKIWFGPAGPQYKHSDLVNNCAYLHII